MTPDANEPPAHTQVLHEDARTRISRLHFTEHTAIRKEPLGPDAAARLAHERAILERLHGVEGVAQLLDVPRYPESIVLADAGRETLARRAMPLEPTALVELATRLARAVAAMHARGVVHRDIHPANIVWST